MSKKRKAQSFIVRMRSTVIEDYEVEAVDEAEARVIIVNGGGNFCNEVERPDWEIEDVRINE